MILDEQEKQRVRDLKRETAVRLSEIDLDGYPVLDRTDGRLREYIESVRGYPEKHNLYELLALLRFFRLLDRYEFRPSAVRRFIVVYESLRFNGMKGVYVPREETVRSFEALLSGKYDSYPESAFLYCGAIEDVERKAKEIREKD